MKVLEGLRNRLALIAVLCVSSLVCNAASAFNVTPSSTFKFVDNALYPTGGYAGLTTDASVFGTLAYSVLADNNVEAGTFAGPINTSFDGTDSNPPTGGLLDLNGVKLTTNVYLLVAGDLDLFTGEFSYYLFNLTAGSYNGYDNIRLDDFWVGDDRISYVALFGSGVVPEPATLSLIGIGLGCVVGRRALRRTKR